MDSNSKMASSNCENGVAASHQKEVKGNGVSGERVCKYCNRKFSNGRALGGHIRTHNTSRFSTNKTTGKDSSSHATNSYYLAGWKVHKKRGSSLVKRSKPESKETQDGGNNNSTNRDNKVEAIEKSQEEETDQDSSSDGDDKGFSMILERLKEFDSNHKIARTRSRYVCLTCNIVFPTFHAVRCHVHQNPSSPANNADEDAKAGKFAEEYDNSDSINQAAVTSNPPRMLDFDLNEMPPLEDE